MDRIIGRVKLFSLSRAYGYKIVHTTQHEHYFNFAYIELLKTVHW